MFVTDKDKKKVSADVTDIMWYQTRRPNKDMNATAATIFTQRPVSTNARAKLFSRELTARAKSIETSPTQSLSSSFDGDQSTTPRGDLVDLKYYLEGLEARLHEPRVGQIMDTGNATTGDLYDLRDELRG